MSVQAQRWSAVLACLGLLAGCVAAPGQEGAYADGQADVCRVQRMAVWEAGQAFKAEVSEEDARDAALSGGAAGGRRELAAALARENDKIDRLQAAFDAAMDCRFRHAQEVRATLAGGGTDLPTATSRMRMLRQRAEQDIAQAEQAIGVIEQRSAVLDRSVDALAPGATRAVLAVRREPLRDMRVNYAAPLFLRPDDTSPEIGTVPARQSVRARASSRGFALVVTASGQRGYVPVDAFVSRRALGTVRATPAGIAGDPRSLAASYIARRDNLAEGVTQAQAALAVGFGLPTGS